MEMENESFEITQREAKKLWDKLFGVEYTVQSMDYLRKQEGIEYIVEHRGDDTWVCSCPSYKFKSGTENVEILDSGKIYEDTCKHIRYVMKREGISFRRTYRRV